MPSPLVRCRCQAHKCNGKLVNPSTARAHERSDLRQKTIDAQTRIQQAGRTKYIIPSALHDQGPISRSVPSLVHPPPRPLSPYLDFNDPPATSDCAVEQEMLDHGSLTREDLDIMTFGSALPNLGPNFHSPEALLAAVDHFSAFNQATAAGARPLTTHEALCSQDNSEERAFQRQLDQLMGDAQEQLESDIPPPDDVELDDEVFDDQYHEDDPEDVPLMADPLQDEDTPDPFAVNDTFHSDDTDLSDIPIHLLTVYAVVSWLHLQFHLPRTACNALLTILRSILIAISPSIITPFVTLQSSNHVLGLDKPILLLPVCPSCLEVYPPAGSLHTKDTCTTCKIPLFKSDLTTRGNTRTVKTPVIKYPYLPLSTQLRSVLKIPGLEAILDQWRTKDRMEGVYTDIFDGDICRRHLKAPDGRLFFSNLSHEKNGPNGELRIGVNLGVDWYVYHQIMISSNSHLLPRFSYIRSNIAPSHSSCPTSFSICNLPPEYR